MIRFTEGDADCGTYEPQQTSPIPIQNYIIAKQYARKSPTTLVITCHFDEQDTVCSHTFQPLVLGCLKNRVQRALYAAYKYPNHYLS